MFLIGLFTATKKRQVHLGRLYVRPIQWHLKQNWRVPGSLEMVVPVPSTGPPPFKMVAGGKQCAPKSTIIPTKTGSAIVYRHIKRRLGRSLKRSHCKGNLVPSRKQATHKLPGTKGGLLFPKRVPRPLPEQHSSYNHRQHHSGCLYKQKRGDEVGPSVCPSVKNPDLVYQQTGYSQSPTHSRPAEYGSRQTIQGRPDNSNRVVSPS